MTGYVPDVLRAVALLLLLAVLLRWHRRFIHLQAQLAAAGGRDLWNERCAYCGRRIRDAEAITHSRTANLNDGTIAVTWFWHANRPACRTSADAAAHRPAWARP